jgi:hypothetical protein
MIIGLFQFFTVLSGVLIVACGLGLFICWAEDIKIDKAPLLKSSKTFVTTFCVFVLLLTFTPSRNDVIFIVGGTALIDVAKSERAKSISTKTLDIVEKYLTDVTKETKP